MQSLTIRETVKESFAGKKEIQSSLSQLDEKRKPLKKTWREKREQA